MHRHAQAPAQDCSVRYVLGNAAKRTGKFALKETGKLARHTGRLALRGAGKLVRRGGKVAEHGGRRLVKSARKTCCRKKCSCAKHALFLLPIVFLVAAVAFLFVKTERLSKLITPRAFRCSDL